MGADLYVEKTGRYYRDSYNPTNVWWVLGMSYWEVLDDLRKKRMIEDGNSVKPEGVKYIMGKLKSKPLTEDLIKAHLTKHKGYIDKSVSYKDWREYFGEKYKEMM